MFGLFLLSTFVLLGAEEAHAVSSYPFRIVDFMQENYASDDAFINYSKHASESNGNGIYLNSESKTYFYRGVVDNNIIYNDSCWQIMGTTTDGAVKFIYNGTPSANKTCENMGDASVAIRDVSYNTTSNGSYVGSNAKAEIDKWFEENLIDYIDDFADVVFCNDTDYAGAHARISERGEPSLACAEEHRLTVANGKLKYPVAMMTADELSLSGAGYSVEPTGGEAYYSDTGKFQTMTQQSANKMFYNNSKHCMNRSSGTNYSASIRPVIAIASESAYILGGTGTKEDPYQLKVVPPVAHKVESLNDSLAVSGDMEEAVFGDKVSFTVNKNRKVKSVRIVDESGNPLDIELALENGVYTFTMPNQNVYIDVQYEEEDAPISTNPATSSFNVGAEIALISACVVCLWALGSRPNRSR